MNVAAHMLSANSPVVPRSENSNLAAQRATSSSHDFATVPHQTSIVCQSTSVEDGASLQIQNLNLDSYKSL